MADMNRYWKCTVAASFGDAANVPFKVGKVYTEYVTDEGSKMTNDLGTTFTCDNGKSIVESIQEMQNDTIALQFERVGVTKEYLSEKFPNIKVGDFVLFKSKETMIEQFGYDSDGCINIPFEFAEPEMDKFTDKVYEVVGCSHVYDLNDGEVQNIIVKAETGRFHFSNCMFVNVTEEVKAGSIPQEKFYKEPSMYDHVIYNNLRNFFENGKKSKIDGVANMDPIEAMITAMLIGNLTRTNEYKMLKSFYEERANMYGENFVDVFVYDMIGAMGSIIEAELRTREYDEDEGEDDE